MSKKIYVPSSEVSHKTTKLRVGINNISRNVIKGYIGMNDVARQFWPDEHVYVWNRYKLSIKTIYEDTMNDGFSTWRHSDSVFEQTKYHTSYVFDSNTGLYTISNLSYPSKSTSKRSLYIKSYTLANYNNNIRYYIENIKPLTDTENDSIIECVYFYNESSTKAGYYCNCYTHTTTQTSSTQKGDYIDQVTSKSVGFYPNDGSQGDYWYVYVGER